MAEKRTKTVRLKLCVKVPGKGIQCEEGGYEATYEEGTVGPTSVTLRYPTPK